MNQFLSRVLLSIFLLAALPLQTYAAMNSVACAGVHGEQDATATTTTESSIHAGHEHSAPIDDEASGATGQPHKTHTSTGFTCGHGAPCCFGTALIGTTPKVSAGNEVRTQFPMVIASFPSIAPSTLERPPRKHLT